LGDVISQWDKNPRLPELPALLEQVSTAFKTKLPKLTEGEVQAVAVDLLVGDYLSGSSSAQRIAKFIEVSLTLVLYYPQFSLNI